MDNYGKLMVIDTFRNNIGKILGYTASGYALFQAHRAEKQGLTNTAEVLRTIGGIGLAGTALTSMAQYYTRIELGYEKGTGPRGYAKVIYGIAKSMYEDSKKTE